MKTNNKFSIEVLTALCSVPFGKVTTYKDLAKKINRPNSARAVGNALNKNEHPITIPCHRVIKSDGSIGGFALGTEMKRKLLEFEGILVKDGFVDLKKYKHD